MGPALVTTTGEVVGAAKIEGAASSARTEIRKTVVAITDACLLCQKTRKETRDQQIERKTMVEEFRCLQS